MRLCNYTILPDLELIIEYFAGDVNAECILEQKGKLIKDPLFNEDYCVLDDFRDAKIDYSMEGIQKIIEWIAKNHNAKRQSAHLTSQPDQVAATMMFDREKSSKLEINLKIFSSLHPAVQWLNIENSAIPRIEAAIESLK